MLSIPRIAAILANHDPEILSTDGSTHAAVALVLREMESGTEILFIRRARREGDPWSGDLGFPGGKVEQGDGDSRATAIRETVEEIGLDLAGAACLGRLDDIRGAHLPVVVSCFVFAVSPGPAFTLSDEVVEAFWFPLAELADPARHLKTTVTFRGEELVRPAIRILGHGDTVLWGITYRLVLGLLGLTG